MTAHRFHTSRPDTSIVPRQSRPNDWGHGRILPMDRPDGEPGVIGGTLFLAGCLVILAVGFVMVGG